MRRSFRRLGDRESLFISNFQNRFIGDDGAVAGEWVYSKDLFCENIHFKREWMSLEEIAAKSMLVNISDAIVMNAKVKYALIGIEIPKSFSTAMMKELWEGFNKTALEFGFLIIGGDTVGGERLNISITLISHTKKPIYRSGVKEGDIVAYTGDLGRSKRDLDRLLRGFKVNSSSKFIRPVLKDRFFYKASSYINAAMDISDGLGKDLSRLSLSSKKGFDFTKKFDKRILCSGEEYEILFSFSPKNLKKILNISKMTRTKITLFAKAKRGRYKNICKSHHF